MLFTSRTCDSTNVKISLYLNYLPGKYQNNKYIFLNKSMQSIISCDFQRHKQNKDYETITNFLL